MNSTGATTITVPTNSGVAFPTNTLVYVLNLGTGTPTITGATGVTVNALDASRTLNGQYALGLLIKRDTNTWLLANLTRGLG